MNKGNFDFSEKDMRQLAEMCAMTLTILGHAMPEKKDKRADEWQQLCIRILKLAKETPSLRRDMELSPDCGYWFFKRSYIDESFYADVMDEYRESAFWEELVSRMVEQTMAEAMGIVAIENLPEDKFKSLAAPQEKALWHEVRQHGLERLMFMLPPGES